CVHNPWRWPARSDAVAATQDRPRLDRAVADSNVAVLDQALYLRARPEHAAAGQEVIEARARRLLFNDPLERLRLLAAQIALIDGHWKTRRAAAMSDRICASS